MLLRWGDVCPSLSEEGTPIIAGGNKDAWPGNWEGEKMVTFVELTPVVFCTGRAVWRGPISFTDVLSSKGTEEGKDNKRLKEVRLGGEEVGGDMKH